MARQINDHRINPANDALTITVLDEPGAGGANHLYAISGIADLKTNPSQKLITSDLDDAADTTLLLFQNGPIAEAGVNGLTQEVLLAIVADRLRSFQAGPFANSYNADALKHVLLAQEALLSRTRERMARGVEGTNQK